MSAERPEPAQASLLMSKPATLFPVNSKLNGWKNAAAHWRLASQGQGRTMPVHFSAIGVVAAYRAPVRHLRTVVNPGLDDGAARQTFC